ncbi:MAG TPA: hypothetical protein VJA25_08130 [Dehalococcoidia bacterium]|nr:hypothetical protein [Dehalococcoidia bacterium]
MTMTITRDPITEVYRISVGVGKLARAKGLQEVANALVHYFRDRLPGYVETYDFHSHIAHAKECSCCPLCRLKTNPEKVSQQEVM